MYNLQKVRSMQLNQAQAISPPITRILSIVHGSNIGKRSINNCIHPLMTFYWLTELGILQGSLYSDSCTEAWEVLHKERRYTHNIAWVLTYESNLYAPVYDSLMFNAPPLPGIFSLAFLYLSSLALLKGVCPSPFLECLSVTWPLIYSRPTHLFDNEVDILIDWM